jgi:hypothetical protein
VTKPCSSCGGQPRYWIEPIPSARDNEPFFTHRLRDGIAVVCHSNLTRCEQVLQLLLASEALKGE